MNLGQEGSENGLEGGVDSPSSFSSIETDFFRLNGDAELQLVGVWTEFENVLIWSGPA